jgi:hypothetical protein
MIYQQVWHIPEKGIALKSKDIKSSTSERGRAISFPVTAWYRKGQREESQE